MKIFTLPEPLLADAVDLWRETGLIRPWNDPGADLGRALSGQSSTVLAGWDDVGRLIGTAMVGSDGHRGSLYYLPVRGSERTSGLRPAIDARVRAVGAWLRPCEDPADGAPR